MEGQDVGLANWTLPADTHGGLSDPTWSDGEGLVGEVLASWPLKHWLLYFLSLDSWMLPWCPFASKPLKTLGVFNRLPSYSPFLFKIAESFSPRQGATTGEGAWVIWTRVWILLQHLGAK